VTASSIEGVGIDTIHKAIEAYFLQTTSNGYLDHQRQLQRKEWFRSALEMQMSSLLISNERVKQLYDAQEAEVMAGKTTPYAAAEMILKNLFL
jgi:LAO/AO transport system kinase